MQKRINGQAVVSPPTDVAANTILYWDATNLRWVSLLAPTGLAPKRIIWNGTGLQWFGKEDGFYIEDDFEGSSAPFGQLAWSATTVNSGLVFQASASVATEPGIVTLSTNTTNNAVALLRLDNGIRLFGGGEFRQTWRFKIATLSDAHDTYKFQIGYADSNSASAHVDGVWLEYDSSSSANWRLVASSNGVTTVTTSTTAVSTSVHDLTIVVNAAGTLATFYLDGVSLGTVASNIPTGASRACGPEAYLQKTGGDVGTTARTVDLYFYSELWLSSAGR